MVCAIHICIHTYEIKTIKGQTNSNQVLLFVNSTKHSASYPQSEHNCAKQQKSSVANPELSSLEGCKKAVLTEIPYFYSIPVACSLHKCTFRATETHWLRDQGVLAVEVDATAAAPGDEQLSAVLHGSSTSASGEAEVTAGANVTPSVPGAKSEGKNLLLLPRFDPASPETLPRWRLDARLKLRLAHLRLTGVRSGGEGVSAKKGTGAQETGHWERAS